MMKQGLRYFLLLALILFIFYPSLFFCTSSFLKGDHLEQHYPWAVYLAKSLKQFTIPLWATLVQAGFPITAEGQIGSFYPPYLFFYFLLPTKIAFCYLSIFHFLAAGFGTLLYCRAINLKNIPAFVSTLIYVFGAGYGGAYYNLISLNTLSWWPVSLYLFEKYRLTSQKRYILFLSATNACMVLGGYLQLAVYALLIFLFYCILRMIFAEKTNRMTGTGKWVLGIFLSLIISLILSAPQLFLTYRLSMMSNRIGLAENYSYLGSMNPIALLSILFPQVQGIFSGSSMYLGILPIFFMISAFHSKINLNIAKLWLIVAVVCLLLSLGQWGGLYPLLIKITQFHSFRVPSKFIIFTCFALSILAGVGFDYMLALSNDSKRKNNFNASKLFFGFVIAGIVIFITTYLFLKFGREMLTRAGNWYIYKYIYAQTGHPHSIESYQDRLSGVLTMFENIFSPSNMINVALFLFLIGNVAWLVWGQRLSKKSYQHWLYTSIVLIIIDLYTYSWLDIRLDFADFKKVFTKNTFVEMLKTEQKNSNLVRLYGFRKVNEKLPLMPSLNIIENIPDIGLYSPLVMGRYFETIGLFGNVNDSNFEHSPKTDWVVERKNILDFMGISHILSSQPFPESNYELLRSDTDYYLYRNKTKVSLAHFIPTASILNDWQSVKQKFLEPGFNPQNEVLFVRSDLREPLNFQNNLTKNEYAIRPIQTGESSEVWELHCSSPGFFVLSKTYFPGWRVTIDGDYAPTLKAFGLFNSVLIKKPGKHVLQFMYKPFAFHD